MDNDYICVNTQLHHKTSILSSDVADTVMKNSVDMNSHVRVWQRASRSSNNTETSVLVSGLKAALLVGKHQNLSMFLAATAALEV